MGNATPTKYQDILDNANMIIEKIQEITYSLCCYWNWSEAIRAPLVLNFLKYVVNSQDYAFMIEMMKVQSKI